MNMDEEYTSLLHTCFALASDCARNRLQKDIIRRIVTMRSTPEQRKQLALLLAENLRFESPIKETDPKLHEDVKATRVWGQILSSPIEKLPILLGVREDLDGLIAERMRSE